MVLSPVLLGPCGMSHGNSTVFLRTFGESMCFCLVPVSLQVFRGHEMEPNDGHSNERLFESGFFHIS